ncbi:MAG: hypothetical protein ACOX6V_00090 [Patescibacteria group bacterium]|jgi:hypothetical protein
MVENKPKPSISVDINPETTPILYTDNIIVSTNQNGLIMDVCQSVGTNRMKIVSRVGMSRIHAKRFAEELSKLLAMTEGKIETGKKQN